MNYPLIIYLPHDSNPKKDSKVLTPGGSSMIFPPIFHTPQVPGGGKLVGTDRVVVARSLGTSPLDPDRWRWPINGNGDGFLSHGGTLW